MTAKRLGQPAGNFKGDVALYKLSEPLNGHEFVVVSTVVASDTDQEETMVFASNKDGEIVNWMDLQVQYGKTHEETLQAAGYELEG